MLDSRIGQERIPQSRCIICRADLRRSIAARTRAGELASSRLRLDPISLPRKEGSSEVVTGPVATLAGSGQLAIFALVGVFNDFWGEPIAFLMLKLGAISRSSLSDRFVLVLQVHKMSLK